MKPAIDIIAAMDHPKMFGPYFKGTSWDGWKAVQRATYGLPMTKTERAFFKSVAGGREPPRRRVREAWYVAGRGAGKDSIAGGDIAFSAATFADQDRLRPGERAVVLCLACDREQARIVLNYTRAFFTDIPALAAMVTRATDDGFELNNGVDIIVATNNYRAPRGKTLLRVVLDEVAFYFDEGTSRPDVETYNALKPGLRLPSSMLIAISTPYRRAGLLWKKYRAHFGKDDDDVLVIQAATSVLNPTIDQSMIDAALAEDPAAASAEWLAEFRTDLESFVSAEAVDACVVEGRLELPPKSGVTYSGFIDAAGGGGGPNGDSFCAAVAHREGEIVVLDAVREVRPKPSFSPEQVIENTVVPLFKAYGIRHAKADRWAGNFPIDRCRAHGIELEAARPKAELYCDFLPVLNSKRCELLDVQRLKSQLLGLERSTRAGGRDVVDHGRGQHDDLINASVGALLEALAQQQMGVCAILAADPGLAGRVIAASAVYARSRMRSRQRIY
jgi:hypothetical protein